MTAGEVTFVDTNVLLYAHDRSETRKQPADRGTRVRWRDVRTDLPECPGVGAVAALRGADDFPRRAYAYAAGVPDASLVDPSTVSDRRSATPVAVDAADRSASRVARGESEPLSCAQYSRFCIRPVLH